MAPKIFITGVTGYIGGDALYALTKAHPDYEYSALIRTQAKADLVLETYPGIKPIIGDLDDASIIEAEAARVDIVLHTADASDHENSARAIAKGLAVHSPDSPGFWLHTGGTGILTYFDTKDDRLGEHSDRSFNDWDDVAELTHLPDQAFHRNVDKLVLQAGTEEKERIKTALVAPPTIYGRGRGPVSTRSRQAYELAGLILTKGYVPIVGRGKARWHQLHVADLSDLWVLLVEAAVEHKKQISQEKDHHHDHGHGHGHESEIWGAKGYYLAENGEFVWADLARLMARRAVELDYIRPDPVERNLTQDEAFRVADFQAVSWGLNARGNGFRAANLLGWAPSRPKIHDVVDSILKDEKERLS